MEDIRLTRRGKILLHELYLKMERRENQDISRFEAKMFSGALEIQQTLLPIWREDDILSTCWELVDKGMIELIPGDNSVQLFWLTDEGIAWEESAGARKLSKAVTILELIRSFLPWL